MCIICCIAFCSSQTLPGYKGSDSSERNVWTGMICLAACGMGALLWGVSSCLVQIISNQLDVMNAVWLPSLLGSLPWLLLRFQAARKRVASSQSQSSGNASDKGAAGRMKHSTDFAFLALLLQPLVHGLQRVSKVLVICPA